MQYTGYSASTTAGWQSNPDYNLPVDSAQFEEQIAATVAASEPGVIAVYLYGSMARDSATSSSDVDVGVLYLRPPPQTLAGQPFGLEAKLERLIGRDVQVIVMNDAPVDLVHRVLRDGRLLYERDRAARIRFEVRARNEFFDLAPILEQYRKAALSRR
jgi:predicted nucleotidyltransferase